jgi:CheY-like chemotaxis protein
LQAQNGKAALETLERSGWVDLLLLDVVLCGGKNGPQVAALAKSRNPAKKILFMSGHAEDAICQQNALIDGVELLNKPFGSRDLIPTGIDQNS